MAQPDPVFPPPARAFLALLLLWAPLGCPRPVLGPTPAAAPQLEAVTAFRPYKEDGTDLAAGEPLLAQKSGDLRVFAGDVLELRGTGLDPLGSRVFVGTTPCQVLSGSTSTLLRVLVPAGMDSDTPRVVSGEGKSARSSQVLKYGGAGHLQELRSAGLVEPQVTVSALGTAGACPGTPDAGCSAVLEQAASVVFNLGPSWSDVAPTFVASVTFRPQVAAVNLWPLSNGQPVRVESVQPYLRAEAPYHVDTAVLVHESTDGGVQTRFVVRGAEVALPGLTGPSSLRSHPAPALDWWALLRQQGPAASLVALRADTSPVLQVAKTWDLEGMRPFAVGSLPANWLQDGRLPPSDNPHLVVLGCREGAGTPVVAHVLELADRPEDSQDRTPAGLPVDADDACQAVCADAGSVQALEPLGRNALLAVPRQRPERLDFAAVPPLCLFSGLPDGDGGMANAAAWKLGQVDSALAAAALWDVRQVLDIQAADPDQPLAMVNSVEITADGRPVGAVRVPSRTLYAALRADPSGTVAVAVAQHGSSVDLLGPRGLRAATRNVLGSVAAAWPLPAPRNDPEVPSGILTVREQFISVTDINGAVLRSSLPSLHLYTAAAERNSNGNVVRLWTAEFSPDSRELVFRYRSMTDPGLSPASQGLRRAWEGGPTPLDLLYVSERTMVVMEYSYDTANAFAGTPCAGHAPVPAQDYAGWVAYVRRTRGDEGEVLVPILGTCNAQPRDFNPFLDLLYLQVGGVDVATHPLDAEVWVVDLGVDAPAEPPADPAANPLVVGRQRRMLSTWVSSLESGGAVGVFQDTSGGAPAAPVLACLAREGHALRVMEAAPVTGTAVAVSPDERRLYAGAPGVLAEFRLRKRAGEACPQLSPLDRVPLTGTPRAMVLDGEGERLLWVDADTESVGLIN